MAYRVKLTPRAQRDLAEIYDRIGANSSEAAKLWYLRPRDTIRTLGTSPFRCPVTPETRQLRQLLYGNKPYVYRVIYRVLEKPRQVDVLHIRHAARQEFEPDDLS